jgi:nucleoside-diphosphate-sugar epimerase
MSQGSERRVLVPGGAGYIGSVLTPTLLAAGYGVRVFDSLLYGNTGTLAGVLEADGFDFVQGDVRSAEQVRSAMEGVTDVVLLAALVGDPVCKKNPDLASQTNLDGARNVIAASADADVGRLIFASTCSNYGLREDDTPAVEGDELKPLSLYAETKVEMEHELLGGNSLPFSPTVLRVATAYGTSPRMRFDLTVSEFTRALTLKQELEVYDADTWRPYCHVADISAAILRVLGAPEDDVRGEVFNVGGEESNHTKRSIVTAALEALERRGEKGSVIWAEGGADARNYRVSFDKIADRLGFEPRHTVPGSIDRLVDAISSGMFADVEDRSLAYRNYELTSELTGGEGTGGGDAG